jgi:hypothetical protein
MSIKGLVARTAFWGVALLALWTLVAANAKGQGKADVVLRNGKIYTADPARSIKQAIVFSDNTILADWAAWGKGLSISMSAFR